MSKESARSSKKGYEDRAAGRAVRIDEHMPTNSFDKLRYVRLVHDSAELPKNLLSPAQCVHCLEVNNSSQK